MICTHISIKMYKHLVITSFLKKHTLLPLYRHFLAFKRCLKHLIIKKILNNYEETVRCERKEKKELASIVVLIAVLSITTDPSFQEMYNSAICL